MNVLIVQLSCLTIFMLLSSVVFIKAVKQNQRDNEVYFLATIILISFIINSFKNYIFTNYMQLGYPLNTFLFRPDDKFNDFFNMLSACRDNNPYLTEYWLKSNYFPIANTIFFLFGMFHFKYISLGVFFCIFFVFYFYFIKSILGSDFKVTQFPVLLILLLLTYPILFNCDRGNIELYVFLFVWGFFYFYNKGKIIIGITFLAMAISMKLFPGVFIILLFKDKKYKEIAMSAFLVGFFFMISLISFNGSILDNLYALINNLTNFNHGFNGLSGLQHNLSLYGAIKVITYGTMVLFGGNADPTMTANTLSWYSFGVLGLFLLICYYVIFIEMVQWRNVTILTIVLLIFPNVSFDYKLIYIMIPLSFLLKSEQKTKFRNIYLFLFAMLLVPQNYIYLINDISIAVLIYPFIMLLIVGLIIAERFMDAGEMEKITV